MAEETVRLPNSQNVNISWRRISTGKLSILYSVEKILPNYLRPPTGSCHDVCKYGRKHESEGKPRVSPLKRVNRSFSGTLSFDSPLRKKALTRKHVDQKCKDLVEEKTLSVIKMETGDEVVESDQNQRCVMDSPSEDPKSEKSQDEAECNETQPDDGTSQEEEEDEDENMSFSENKNTTRQGKSKAFSAESANSMKLRIKRGKIVDIGSESNSPRKLRSKRGKVVTGADTTSKSGGRRRLKTKGTNFSNDREQQHKPRVVLKHQDTQKKRDSRVWLLNNVIEERANKLVKTRKSKVKALVGAFESVISLHDGSKSKGLKIGLHLQQHKAQK